MDVPCQHQLYGSVKRNPPVGDLGFFFPAWDALPFWNTAQAPRQVDAARLVGPTRGGVVVDKSVPGLSF